MQKSTNQFQKYEQRGTHESLHFQLQDNIDSDRFAKYLNQKQLEEIQKNTKTIWIHLNQQNLHLCGPLVKRGYKIHNGLDNKIELYKWITKGDDLVPPYSMIYLGCGGIIIDNDCLLLVQENNGPRKDEWGLSGGLLNRGQFISEGAERQVWQETGLKTKFQYIIYFRQVDKYIHNSMDTYFACYLKLSQGYTRQSIKLCSQQINDHKWIPLNQLQEFVSTNKFGGTQKAVMQLIIHLNKTGYKFDDNCPIKTTVGITISRGVQKRLIEHRIINL